MNIPFPQFFPRMFTPNWITDRPFDDDAELTMLEQANQQWLNSIAKQYMKPVDKRNVVPPEETGSDSDANDDAEVSEGSQDADEVEEIPITESPQINIEEPSESPEDNTEAPAVEVETTVDPNDTQRD